MAAFNYTAFDAHGRVQRGEVDVATQTQAIKFIKEMGLFPTPEADGLVAVLTSLLRPLMIVLIALIVGGLVIALFLPLLANMRGVEGSEGFNSR